MPDIPAPIPEPSNATPKPVVELQIVLLSDGNVSVTGPIEDAPLTMKMIGQALSAVADFKKRKEVDGGARLVRAGALPPILAMNGRA